MKARIKGTNTIVECLEADYLDYVGFGIKCKHSNGCYEIISGDCLIELENDFDWQSFRAEAAKDILCSMIELIEHEYSAIDKDYWCGYAVEWTDVLVKKLKEKEA